MVAVSASTSMALYIYFVLAPRIINSPPIHPRPLYSVMIGPILSTPNPLICDVNITQFGDSAVVSTEIDGSAPL